MSTQLSRHRYKHPGETLDYTVDFSEWLTTGDTIQSVTWDLATVSGLIQEDATITDTTATIWLAGGVDGGKYPVICTATTAQGRIVQFAFEIRGRAIL